MDELQKENLQQKQQISELQRGNDSLELELQSSQDGMLQLEQQLEEKKKLVRCIPYCVIQSRLHTVVECNPSLIVCLFVYKYL